MDPDVVARQFEEQHYKSVYENRAGYQDEHYYGGVRYQQRREVTGRAGEMGPEQLARAFVEHYYATFDTNRAGLAGLYQDESMLTFEGQKIQGSPNIIAKLTSLPFQQCQHGITTVDWQLSGPAGGMLVFVSGNLQLAGGQHPLKFNQVFHLKPTPQGSFYVLNDILHLNHA